MYTCRFSPKQIKIGWIIIWSWRMWIGIFLILNFILFIDTTFSIQSWIVGWLISDQFNTVIIWWWTTVLFVFNDAMYVNLINNCHVWVIQNSSLSFPQVFSMIACQHQLDLIGRFLGFNFFRNNMLGLEYHTIFPCVYQFRSLPTGFSMLRELRSHQTPTYPCLLGMRMVWMTSVQVNNRSHFRLMSWLLHNFVP